MTALPAILGGRPAFQDQVQMVRPVLPDWVELAPGVGQMLSTGMVTKGRYLESFEQSIAEHLGVEHAVAVSSCTSGLMLTYRGLQLSGEVVVPSFTFMATVSALIWSGLRPVFAEVDSGTTNVTAEAVEAAITPQTTAIVAVHNFGNPAEIDSLLSIANDYGLALIFDAAHGFGSLYQGVPVGKQGTAQVFSLSPTKLLIAGEGGVVATNDGPLADFVRQGREYGNSGNYDAGFAGLNARMPEFNALLGINSLSRLEAAAVGRNETAGLYQEILGNLPGIGFQIVRPKNRNSYKDFSITIDADSFSLDRDQLAIALAAENIDTRKYYDPPVHRQNAYRQFFNGHPLEVTDWLAAHSLSFPIWSNMDPDVPLRIGETVQRIHAAAPAINAKITA